MMHELLERIAVAVETSAKLTVEAQADYRANAKRQFKLAEAAQALQRQAQNAARDEAMVTAKLLAEQARRNERSLSLAEAELSRLRARDEEYTAYLRAAAERSAESLEVVKTATGLGAPDFVPENLVSVPDDNEDEDSAE